MRKNFIIALFATLFLVSCGGSGSDSGSGPDGKRLLPEKTDYKMFTDEAEVKRVMDGVIAKAGDNMSKIDEIDISISRPSKIGSVRFDRPDNASIRLIHLNPDDPKTLRENRYWSGDGKWDGETKTVQLLVGDAENFVLADEMYDASALTSDMVAKTVMEAWNKYKDDTKYSEQWVEDIKIKEGKITVLVRGILASNGIDKYETYEKKLK
ncbi:MAG: hypothetical protein ACLVKO_06155 [Dysgonomonas sp.]